MSTIISLILAVFFSVNTTFSNECNPVIELKAESGILLKEGHQKNQKVSGVYIEMDSYCFQEVRLTVLVREGSAKIGEHIIADEINEIVIPAGQISGYLRFAIIGDNEWNEDRQFSIQGINPSSGHISISTVDFTIQNDDPKIELVIPKKVTEPRQGYIDVPVKVRLSMPAEQRITGEVEFVGQSAQKGEDFEAPFSSGFEILPGESEYEFLPNTLIIKSDDQKESTESLRLFLNGVKNATAINQSALVLINEIKSYSITLSSKIEAIGEGRVVMASNYSFTDQVSEENADGTFSSKVIIPTYRHKVTDMPFPIKAFPGKSQITLLFKDETLFSIRLELIESPYEIYPYISNKMYMFASSFGKLHEDEFITIQRPNTSKYPAFDLKKIQLVKEGTWKAEYKKNILENGEIALREETSILIKENE